MELTHGLSNDNGRRWLGLRCYMNPAGWVTNPRNESDRLYFSRFRPYFVRAGFDVVDCPTLARGKNAADIRIVIDIMTALQGPAHIEEFVLASSDADFTPLLHVVRAHDRLITMIATGPTATAYEALADRVLDAQAMVDLMGSEIPTEGNRETVLPQLPASGAGTPIEDSFAAEVSARYTSATEPINLAQTASQIANLLGPEVRASNWMGTGSFIRAVHRLNLPNIAFSQHYMWDASRHTPPAQSMNAGALPPEIAKFCQVADMPRIPSGDWPVAFAYLEEYAKTQQFSLTEASRWPRDRSQDAGHLIARAVFLYIVNACHSQGTRLDVDPPPTAEQLAHATLSSVMDQTQLAGVEVTEDDKQDLRAWLGL